MRTFAAALAFVLSACGGSGPSSSPDAGAGGADAAEIPVYQLRIGVNLGFAAIATANGDSLMNPNATTTVIDLASVNYDQAYQAAGASGEAHVSIVRLDHGFTFTGNVSGTSPKGPGAGGTAAMRLDGVCVTARGAKAFRVTYQCDGTVTSSGSGLSGITASAGAIELCHRVLDSSIPRDEPWNPASHTVDVAATAGENCWSEDADLSVLTGGGADDAYAGTAQGTITFTVEPTY